MPYVQRNAQGQIIGAYANLQSGYAEELLSDNDPALVAFLAPKPPLDISDINNLDKAFRALGLLIAQYTGKTPATVRADFMAIYKGLVG